MYIQAAYLECALLISLPACTTPGQCNVCLSAIRVAFFQVIFLLSRKPSLLSLWESLQAGVNILPISGSKYTYMTLLSSDLSNYPLFVAGQYVTHLNSNMPVCFNNLYCFRGVLA